ncbi:protein phosphatase [Bodo saltans virus]|uniref:Protein phosphatase n=1 Tax=Bodo saltans virus TaxID=2024608 RepID=A0A2H4UVX1_9VIRU|nr:protein phosphatase [Bodo saltans virus]ATZ81088.1 protein phosphatase [Bodo saltans virus]
MKKTAIFILLLACISAYKFMSIGDWGCMSIGGIHAKDQIIVAKEFTKFAQQLTPRFILNTGDNFYYCGINGTNDPNFATTFENVYSDDSLMVPWIGCLGNHDYGYPGSAEAQMNYVSPETNISLVVLDSSPCQSPYTSNDPSGWDPCGSVIPGCPGCTFHQNVIKQSCQEQYMWFEQIVNHIPSDDWKILMTHAPALDINNYDYVPLIRKTGFHMYINGHVHLLAHYTIDNAGVYISSGAGCMVEIPYEHQYMNSCSNYNKNHTCQIVFQKTVAGFTVHEFNTDYTILYTYFYSYDGKLLHTVTINK